MAVSLSTVAFAAEDEAADDVIIVVGDEAICTHTWQHDIPQSLIKLVGTEKFEAWKTENASDTVCNINIFKFLKDFKITNQSFMKAYGSLMKDKAQLNEILTAVYPELNKKPAVVVPANDDKDYLSEVEQGIITEINAERKALGLVELKYNESLRKASRIRSKELYKNDWWAHTRPNGDPWQTVLSTEVPMKYKTAGENLANIIYNDPSLNYHNDPEWWFEEWKSSETHYENIIRPNFTYIGVGVYYIVDDAGMKTAYATTIFAEL